MWVIAVGVNKRITNKNKILSWKILIMFTYEELFILSSGLLVLIDNISQAKKLVYEEKSQAALDEELKLYQELNTKLMELCK